MLLEKLRSLPTIAVFGIAIAIISSATGVATLSVDVLSTTARLADETFDTDVATSVGNTGISKVSSSASATGQSQVAAIDAGSNIAGTVVNGALSATHFIYQFEVKESGVNTWPATREYRIEVFVDSVLTETLYINNSSADASNVEGVTARVTLGAGPTLADNLTVKVQKISND